MPSIYDLKIEILSCIEALKPEERDPDLIYSKIKSILDIQHCKDEQLKNVALTLITLFDGDTEVSKGLCELNGKIINGITRYLDDKGINWIQEEEDLDR